MHARIRISISVLALAVLAAVPATVFGHATVSALQPQGSDALLTAKRVLYVLSVPSERSHQNTVRVTLYVPDAVQTRIRVKKVAGWKLQLKREDSGQVDGEGAKIYKITQVTYTARADGAIEPNSFEDFPLRIQNPTTAGKLCFAVRQVYTPAKAGGKREVVYWNGPSGSAHPASCVTITA